MSAIYEPFIAAVTSEEKAKPGASTIPVGQVSGNGGTSPPAGCAMIPLCKPPPPGRFLGHNIQSKAVRSGVPLLELLPAGREAKEAGARSSKDIFAAIWTVPLSRLFRGYSPPIDRPRLPPVV